MRLLKYALATSKGHFVFRAKDFRSVCDVQGEKIGSLVIPAQTVVTVSDGSCVGITPIVTAEQVMKDVQEALTAKEQA